MAEDFIMSNVTNPRFNSYGSIDVTIDHDTFGTIEFTASPEDLEQHGRDIYQSAIDGEYGAITEYVPE